MLLCNLHRVPDGDLIDLEVKGKCIRSILPAQKKKLPEAISFEDVIVFPGLINSHDHLDFNLFPRLGNRIYKNYVEWGNDIHENNKDVIEKVLKVPYDLRVQWGVYKNLLNGVTTVVNHSRKLHAKNFPIKIYEECQVLHSIQLEKNWKLKLNSRILGTKPVVIHIGEGTDNRARTEIDELIAWNLLRKKLIGIHAISMSELQASKFDAVVWCPVSNHFLIGQTAAMETLAGRTKILFGTDSTVSAGWNIWDHLRLAQKEKKLNDTELFNSLTINPAEVWKLGQCGQLKENFRADLVIAKKKAQSAKEAFYLVNPEDILLVVHRGSVVLFDESLHHFFGSMQAGSYQKINYHSCAKYVKGNLNTIAGQIRDNYPEVNFPFSV